MARITTFDFKGKDIEECAKLVASDLAGASALQGISTESLGIWGAMGIIQSGLLVKMGRSVELYNKFIFKYMKLDADKGIDQLVEEGNIALLFEKLHITSKTKMEEEAKLKALGLPTVMPA